MKLIFLGCGYLGYNLSELLKNKFDVEIWGLSGPYSEKSSCFSEIDVFSSTAFDGKEGSLKGAIVFDTISLISSVATKENEEEELEKLSSVYKELFEKLKDQEIKSYYFLSSGGTVYGDSKIPHKEEDELNPKTLYAKSKVRIEKLLQESGMNWMILRLSNPYGGYQLANRQQGVIPILFEKARNQEIFEVWSDPASSRDYLYIQDMAEVIFSLIQRKVENKIVNVGSGMATSLQEVIETVQEEMGFIQTERKEGPIKSISDNVLDISQLKQLTGFTPQITIKEGIKKEFNRLKEEEK